MRVDHYQPPFTGCIKENELSFKQKRCVAVTIANIIVFVALVTQFKKEGLGDLSPSTIESVVHVFKPDPVVLHVIPINNETNVSIPFVHSILHNPEEASIIVNFSNNRTCIQPQLIGRLSGMSLALIEWDHDNKQNQNYSVLVGYYNVPSRGPYFIEIIVTMCQKLTMDTDIKDVCLVDPKHHRLTHKNATLNATTIRKKGADIGVWYNMDHIRNNSSTVPLHTRYQPLGCIDNPVLDFCKKHTEVARYEPYEFLFHSQMPSSSGLGGEKGTLCFVGASHAAVLRDYSLEMGADALHMELLLVREYKHTEAARASTCDKIVIGIGQWDLGFPQGYPTSFNEFKRELNRTMVEFVNPLREANKSVYFRNLHYNGLGEHFISCPPIDWRNPPAVDMYNEIIEEVCKDFGVPFIDTRNITGLMWERAEDWCHYRDISGKMEALYFLQKLNVYYNSTMPI